MKHMERRHFLKAATVAALLQGIGETRADGKATSEQNLLLELVRLAGLFNCHTRCVFYTHDFRSLNEILVHGHDPIKRQKDLDLLLQIADGPLRRVRYGSEVWVETTVRGTRVIVTSVGKCTAIKTTETIEEPEMVPTGKMLRRTVTKTEWKCAGVENEGPEETETPF